MALSPYFRSLSRQRRVCPWCLRGTLSVEPSDSGDPDAAWDVHEACGYRQLRLAPPNARVGTGPTAPPGEGQALVDELNAGLRGERAAPRGAKVIQFRPRA